MKNLRKHLSLLLCAVMLIAALASAGCGNVSGDTDITSADQTEAPVNDNPTTQEITTAEPVITTDFKDTPEGAFRYDNFANGRLSNKLLDSVNPGVLALLSCCMYYEDQLQQGIKRGEKWVYSNSSTYVPQSGTFDDMVKSGKTGTNCAMPQAWAFIDLGVVQNGKHIYGNTSGDMANFSSLGKYIGAVCTLTAWEGSCKFNELYAKKLVKPGDIFLAKGHTFIFLGDNKFLAAGHDGKWHTDNSANTEDSRKAVFDTWVCNMTDCSDYTYTVFWQIRFKDEYVPRFYRNAEGKLVANPAYDASKNIEYKPRVTPEVPEVIYPNGDKDVFDTSGRTNVLLKVATEAKQGFNLGKIDSPANLTDGQLYYDNTVRTYSDCTVAGGSAYALAPTYWFDANGEKSETKDASHKYLCGIKFELGAVKTVDSFSLYTQAVGASTGKPFGDIDGFDVLVSADGKNWTVAYSAEDMTNKDKWTYPTEAVNKSSAGYYMCHFIRANFDKAYEAKYICLALTTPRTAVPGKAQGTDYSLADSSSHYFRISEFQVYQKQ